MNCYLKIISQFDPAGKFEFPGKNLNQSEKRIYEEILGNNRSSAVFFILNYLRNRKENIFPVTTVFLGFACKR